MEDKITPPNREIKFKIGDEVRIVNYGHLMFEAKRGYSEKSLIYAKMDIESDLRVYFNKVATEDDLNKAVGKEAPSNIIHENEDYWWVDTASYLVGRTDVVKLANDTQGNDSYSLENNGAWFSNSNLELLND